MRKIKVNLGLRSYDIIIGRGIFNKLGLELLKLNLGRDAYIITNSLVKNKYGAILRKELLTVSYTHLTLPTIYSV